MSVVLHKRELWTIPVGTVGSLDIRIPVITIGKGGPVLTFISGIHGNESTSLFLFRELIKELEQSADLIGTVNLAYFANPLAFAERNRVATQDNVDMNRISVGKAGGLLAERILYRIYEVLLKKSNFVIDLHELEMRSALIAVLPSFGSDKIQKESLELLAAFEPELVWCPDIKGFEEKFLSIMTFELLRAGIPSVMVEWTTSAQLADGFIGSVVQRCLNLARRMNVLKSKLVSIKKGGVRTVAVARELITSDWSGLFYPEVDLRICDLVHAGEVMGKLVDFGSWEEREITANEEGLLMEIRHRSPVSTGTNLFSIGIINQMVTAAVEALQEGMF